MDEAVRAALAKWPDVPAVFGWLALDQRGQWRLRGERIEHRGANAFIGRNYLADEAGRWFCQNGPQQVFVELAYTPWVLRLSPDGALNTHIGTPFSAPDTVWLDDEGHLLISNANDEVGLLDDRDLGLAVASLQSADGTPIDLDTLLAGPPPEDSGLRLGEGWLPLKPILREAVPGRFGFQPSPEE